VTTTSVTPARRRPSPPEGRYVVGLSNTIKLPFLFVVDPGDIRLDINVDGETSCQVVNIDETEEFELPLDYP
jgi:hypothetical protein